jgi:hypothetical protein
MNTNQKCFLLFVFIRGRFSFFSALRLSASAIQILR